ncbi:MAG: hypothetical protein JXN59_07630 [Anaerolineae bacterium]|nr:hypothetical protein [Anaerolineae bacterium]
MRPYTPSRRDWLLVGGVALVVAAVVAAGIPGPTHTDAYYYFNAGQRLAAGQGLTDPYIALTYLNAPEALPAPAHTYWMPLASLLVTLAGGSFRLAQAIFAGLWVGLALLACWLGARLGGTARHARAAGLLAVFCGFYAPYLVMPETFAPFGLAGALCLLLLGLGRLREDWRLFGLAGMLAALAHLTRADGLLLVIVLLAVVAWPEGGKSYRAGRRAAGGLAGLGGYTLVMLPWFARNLRVIGAPLPLGGTATMWLRGYNELVSYPPSMSLENFLQWGLENILASRWEAFTNNLGTFVAVEGLVVLAPLIVLALARRWREPLILPVALYALALHLAMTLAFAYPGYRGGLFHSAAALIPWWMALGLLGLDDAVDWVARQRRTWRPAQAKRVFTVAVVGVGLLLTISTVSGRWGGAAPSGYAPLGELLPPDAVVMINDPAALYAQTGLFGVVVPDSGPEAVRALVGRYGVTHVVLDHNRTAPLDDLYAGRVTVDFLQPMAQDVLPALRIFAVVP